MGGLALLAGEEKNGNRGRFQGPEDGKQGEGDCSGAARLKWGTVGPKPEEGGGQIFLSGTYTRTGGEGGWDGGRRLKV